MVAKHNLEKLLKFVFCLFWIIWKFVLYLLNMFWMWLFATCFKILHYSWDAVEKCAMQCTVPCCWCLVTGCQICPRYIVKVCVVLINIIICTMLPYKTLQFSAIGTMYNAMHWGLAVGVLSLVAKYAARSVSQPSIHVYPELYVKNLQRICTILWTLMSSNISDSYPFHTKNTQYKISFTPFSTWIASVFCYL